MDPQRGRRSAIASERSRRASVLASSEPGEAGNVLIKAEEVRVAEPPSRVTAARSQARRSRVVLITAEEVRVAEPRKPATTPSSASRGRLAYFRKPS
jgi:hypothetical protein